MRSFPEVEKGRWQISTGGGTQPVWARNGKELFYIGPDGRLTAAGVQAGQAFAFAAPKAILERRYYSAISGRPYDVSPDGQRFLMIKEGGTGAETSAAPQLIVVLNWLEELKRLVKNTDK